MFCSYQKPASFGVATSKNNGFIYDSAEGTPSGERGKENWISYISYVCVCVRVFSDSHEGEFSGNFPAKWDLNFKEKTRECVFKSSVSIQRDGFEQEARTGKFEI